MSDYKLFVKQGREGSYVQSEHELSEPYRLQPNQREKREGGWGRVIFLQHQTETLLRRDRKIPDPTLPLILSQLTSNNSRVERTKTDKDNDWDWSTVVGTTTITPSYGDVKGVSVSGTKGPDRGNGKGQDTNTSTPDLLHSYNHYLHLSPKRSRIIRDGSLLYYPPVPRLR